MNYFGAFGTDQTEALPKFLPVLEVALAAHQTGDYDAYLSVVTKALASKVSRSGFAKAHKEVAPQLGELKSKRFLGAIKKHNKPTLLFVANYANCEDDVLISATFENNTLPAKIDWLWIE